MVLTHVVLNCIEFSEMMTIQIVITMFTSAKAMPTISGLPSGQWLFLNISKMRLLVMELVKKKNPPAMQEAWVRSLGWKIPWRRKWQPTPVFLPGESHGQRSLAGYSP